MEKKVLKNVKPLGPDKPICGNIYLLTSAQASHLFLPEARATEIPIEKPSIKKNSEAGTLRAITIGINKAAEAPSDVDFNDAAIYTISNLPPSANRDNLMLQINYRGDVGRLYYDGKLIADNFYNGRPMLYGLWRLPSDATELEFRILPLQADMPIYFPEEADTTPGEEVTDITIIPAIQ